MIFNFKNLGTIKEADIELGNLTVICGKNNTGKTYLSYAVYGFFNQFIYSFFDTEEGKIYISQLYDKLITQKFIDFDIDEVVSILKRHYINIFDNFFGSNGNKIPQKGFDLELIIPHSLSFTEIDNDEVNVKQIAQKKIRITAKENFLKYGEIQKIIYSHDFDFLIMVAILGRQIFQRTFIISAARTGIQLFHRELDGYRQYDRIKSYNIKDKAIIYALSIEDNIRFQRDIPELIKTITPLNEGLINFLEKELLEIDSYTIDKYDIRNVVLKNKDTLPFNLASSSIHALTDLYFYCKYKIQKGDLLMIDEPELNLHPENQIKLARLFVKLVNAGVKVWITTHSDYIIKEINNCLMLNNEFEGKQKLMKEYHYQKDEILNKDDLRVYIAENHTVRQVEVDEYGMKESSFDDTLNYINNVSDDLTTAIYNQSKVPVNN